MNKRFLKWKVFSEVLIILIFLTAGLSTAVAIENVVSWYENDSSDSTILITPQIFPGFYYGFDSNSRELFSEKIVFEVNKDKRAIEEGKFVYSSGSKSIPFACESLGSYDFMAWFGKPYIASYDKKNGFVSGNDERDFISKNVLFPILRDESLNEKKSFGDKIDLNEDYEICFEKNEDDVFIILKKDGEVLDKQAETEVYAYKEDIKSVGNVPIILVHSDFDKIGVRVKGIFQISEKPLYLEEENYSGALTEFKQESGEIKLTNKKAIELRRGNTIKINDMVSLNVADNKRLNIFVEGKNSTRKLKSLDTGPSSAEPDQKFEYSGEITDQFNKVNTWDGKNFYLFYDEKNNVRNKEVFLIEKVGGKVIEKGDMEYSTRTESKEYKYAEWEEYEIIKIAGEDFCSGILSNSFSKRDENFIRSGFVTKVLTDDSKKEGIKLGESLQLKQGYSLYIKNISNDIDSNYCEIELKKDDVLLSSRKIESGEDFVYKINYLNKEIPAIAVHIDSIFKGEKEQVVTISGVFQLSEEIVEIKPGNVFNKMIIAGVSSSEIKFENKESLNLTKDSTIPIIGNLYLYISNASKPAIFPYKGNGTIKAEIKLKEANIEALEPFVLNKSVSLKIVDKISGQNLEGVEVFANDKSIGKTESGGILYIPMETKVEIKATYPGYKQIVKSFDVLGPEKTLDLEIPELIFKNDEISLITKDGNENPVKSVKISLKDLKAETENEVLSDEEGVVKFTIENISDYEIKAEKEDFAKFTRKFTSIEKAPYFVIKEIKVPEMYENKNNKIVISVENVGREAGDYSLNATLGNITKEKTVFIKQNETKNVSLYFKTEQGDYELKVENKTVETQVLPKKSFWSFLIGEKDEGDKPEPKTNPKTELKSEPKEEIKENAKEINESDGKTNSKNNANIVLALTVTAVLFILLFISILGFVLNPGNSNILSRIKNSYRNKNSYKNNYDSSYNSKRKNSFNEGYRNNQSINYKKMYEKRSSGKSYGKNNTSNKSLKDSLVKLFKRK